MNGSSPGQQNMTHNCFAYHPPFHPGTKSKSFGSTLVSTPQSFPVMGAPSFDNETDRPDSPSACMKLDNQELWESFDNHGTEMVITKAGR